MKLSDLSETTIKQFEDAAKIHGVSPDAYYHLFSNHYHPNDDSPPTVTMLVAMEAIKIDRESK